MTHPGPRLSWSIVRSDDSCTVVCEGEVDLVTADQFQEALSSALDPPVKMLYIDLSAMEFFGSDGVRVLVRTKRLCDGEGVDLIVRANDRVHRVLQITGLERELKIEAAE